MSSPLDFASIHQGILNADQVTVRYDRRRAPGGKSSGNSPSPLGTPLSPGDPTEPYPLPWDSLNRYLRVLTAETAVQRQLHWRPVELRGNVYRCILYTAVELYTVYRCIPLYTAVELYTSASGAGRGECAVYR